MIKFFNEPFGFKKILTKEEIKGNVTRMDRHGRPIDQKANDIWGTLKRLWKFISHERILLLFIVIFVIGVALLSIAGPFLVGHIVDNYFIAGEMDGLMTILLILLAIYIGHAIFQYVASFTMVGLAQRTVYRMRERLFTHMQVLSVRFFDKRQHGELMSRMTNDIETISQTLNSSFIQFTLSIVTLIGTVSVMIYLSPLLTVITLTIIPLLFVGIRFVTSRTGPLYKKRQQRTGELNGYIEEIVSGQEIVKVFSQEETAIKDFDEKAANLRDTTFWAFLYAGMIPKIMNMLNNLGFTLVAGVGGLLVFYTDGIVTVGTIVIFAEYARQFTRPLADLANQFNQVLSAIAGAERVFGIIDTEPEDDSGEIEDKIIHGNIDFKNVVFSYDKDQSKPTINDLTFNIKAGESVALIGATGAGKTTVMQLLARFYEVDGGEILVDEINLNKYKRSTIRSQTAFVLQDPYLFEASIKDNIRYGKLDATDEEIIRAAKLANAHEFIMELENGYDTVLELDEGFVSQGQKQLLSIARAFITDPAILLLDEATSSIDTVTELKIQDALESLMKGRTSIIIAHRLNTIKAVDRIFVLENGEMLESGTEEELMAHGGRYYEMISNND